MNNHTLAIIATVDPENKPEAAVIEFAETEDLELTFNTLSTYRKCKNLLRFQGLNILPLIKKSTPGNR